MRTILEQMWFYPIENSQAEPTENNKKFTDQLKAAHDALYRTLSMEQQMLLVEYINLISKSNTEQNKSQFIRGAKAGAKFIAETLCSKSKEDDLIRIYTAKDKN